MTKFPLKLSLKVNWINLKFGTTTMPKRLVLSSSKRSQNTTISSICSKTKISNCPWELPLNLRKRIALWLL